MKHIRAIFIIILCMALLCLFPALVAAEEMVSASSTLITDTSQLEDGDQILLVSIKYGKYKTMHVIDGSKHIYSSSVTLNNNQVTERSSDATPLILEKTNGGWRLKWFYDRSYPYYRYISVKDGDLISVKSANDATIWSISISGGSATISANEASICYDDLDFYYGSGGNPIAIYSASWSSCGPNLSWRYYRDGTALKVTIAGSGYMEKSPWYQHRSEITQVSLPEGMTSIGYRSFYECNSITSIDIPSSVQAIGALAFSGCSGLTSVTIPSSVTSIGDLAFSGCTRLMSIQVAQGNQNYVSVSGVLFSRDKTKLLEYPAGKKGGYSVPSGVTNIESRAFEGCEELTSITIPASVQTIGRYAFASCSGLTAVTIENSVTSIGEGMFSWCRGLKSITIPNSVTSIGAGAFIACEALETVNYLGTAAQRAKIKIEHDNDALLNATWRYMTAKPTIATQPKAVRVNQGKKATFKVVATGDGLSYKWQYQKPGESSWNDVIYNGASATYTLTTATRHNGYKYRCRVTNAAGSVYSNAVTLTVKTKPVITAQPKGVTVNEGKAATFKVVATGATGYKWQYQKPGSSTWTDVSNNGASATYTLTTAARHNGYKYRCKVTNAAGSVYTNSVTLTVTTEAKPAITTQPKSVTVNEGAKATFKVVATGATGYKWQYQKPGSSTWTDVSKNGTSATYSLTTAARHNGYKYRCKVTNASGSVYTSAVKLTVK